MSWTNLLPLLGLLQHTSAQSQPSGVDPPLAQRCGPNSSNIVCINQYASVLPYHFYRNTSTTEAPVPFSSTSVPNDTSFSLTRDSNFLIFDKERGLELLGDSPQYEKMFNISDYTHEAPVYVPGLNKLFLSQLGPPGYLPQLVVDLNADPPTLSEFVSDPPVYAPNGGRYHNGLIYWGVSGGNQSLGGIEQRPGIRTLNPHTNKTETLLNNYYGYYFNTVDDLFIDRSGAIWFTDPQYSYAEGLNNVRPQLQPAVYRFDPKTGSVTMVDDSFGQPNGISISPDGEHIYICDSGSYSSGTVASNSTRGNTWHQTYKRTVYKYDVVDGGTHVINKRPIYFASGWIPDGMKVAANGYILTADGNAVDVIDSYGVLIARIQTDYLVVNFAWAGPDLSELWLVGAGGISRVRWNLRGQPLTNRTQSA